MGLGKATANRIAQLQSAPANERSTIFWTALFVNGGFGSLAALILWATGTLLLTTILKIPPDFHNEVIAALPWLIATLPLALISSVLNGALEGRNQFFTVNVLQVVSSVLFQIIPLAAAYRYGSSLAIVIPVAVVTRVLMNLPFLVACYVAVPLTPQPTFSKKAAQFLLSYGGWIAITGMIGPLLEAIDRFLIGVVLGAQAVTHYTVPYQLVTRTRIIPASLSRALFPKFSAATALDADHLAMMSLRSLIIIVTPITLGGIVILRTFMNIWIGRELASIASPLGEILLFGVWANSLAYIPYSLLQGQRRPDLVAKFHAAELFPFLILIWGAMHFFGVYGAAAAWTIRVIADSVLLFHFSGLRRGLIRATGMPILMIIIAIVCTNCLGNVGWLWRAGLAIFLGSWCGLWLKKQYSLEITPLLQRVGRAATLAR